MTDLNQIEEWSTWKDSLTGIFVSYDQEKREITNFTFNEELGKIIIPKEEIPSKKFSLDLVADGYVTLVLRGV